jgi:mannosyltransferase OCH1-like enzyme
MSIPKITHQIWLQGWEERPEKFNENIRLLHELNPDWIHMNWDEEKMLIELKKLGAEYVKKYHAFEKLIQKVDFGRYAILYNYGGVSIDLDMKSLKSLNNTPEVHTSDFIISEASHASSIASHLFKYNNATIFCSPQHRYMRKLIEAILENNKTCKDYSSDFLCVTHTTGPEIFSTVLANENDIVVLKKDLFEPCYGIIADIVNCKPKPESIIDHQHEQSWIPGWLKILTRVFFTLLQFWPLLVAYIVWRMWPRISKIKYRWNK